MITIELLKNHPNAIPTLAEIWISVLGKIWLPDISSETLVEKFTAHLNYDKLPITFVALDNGKPIGMCSLRGNDGIRPDLIPWLASLVIDTAYQKQGIGEMLIRATKKKAYELGFSKLYLFTFDPNLPSYYSRFGFEKIGMDEFQEHEVTVMQASTNPNKKFSQAH